MSSTALQSALAMPSQTASMARHFTIGQVAEQWGLSEDTVRRLFEHGTSVHGGTSIVTAVPGGYRHNTYAQVGVNAARVASLEGDGFRIIEAVANHHAPALLRFQILNDAFERGIESHRLLRFSRFFQLGDLVARDVPERQPSPGRFH